ncbi:DnaJ sub C member 21 [Kalmusia sp. IMI 367209]|nr:DnaJ sub C member 21 [Kalmusia sp. IMI 367209]
MPQLRQAKRPNYYADLGVDKDATPSDIKRAYCRLVLEHHPDKKRPSENVEDVAAEFRKVQEAYEVLRDPTKRDKYDHTYEVPRGGAQGSDGSSYDYPEREYDYSNPDYYKSGNYGVWSSYGDLFRRRRTAHAQPYSSGGYFAYARYYNSDYENFETFQAHEEAERREFEARAAEKTRKLVQEEEERHYIIEKEDIMHEKFAAKSNRGLKSQAPSRKNCTCAACRDRFFRENTEKDEKKMDLETYTERMRIRARIAARKEKEAADARLEAELLAEKQRAAEEAAAADKKAKEKAAAVEKKAKGNAKRQSHGVVEDAQQQTPGQETV